MFVVGLAALLISLVGSRSWLPSRTESAASHLDATHHQPDKVQERFATSFGHVDVETGVSSLYPSQPGRVMEIVVGENDDVKKGAPLLKLDDRLAQARVKEAEADIKAAEKMLPEIRKLPEQHQHKLRQQQEAVEVAKRRLAAAQHMSNYQKSLQQSNLQNPEEVKAVEERVKEAEAGVRAEEDKLLELKLVDPTVNVARAEADLEAKRARLEQAQVMLSESVLKAPTDGRVLRILVSVGDQLGVQPRPVAIQFCPRVPRIIRAEVEQESASRVHLNQEAEIEDDSRNGGAWKGRVIRISDWYTQRRSILMDPLQFNDVRTLECILAVEEGSDKPVRIGQRVRVRFKQ